MEEKVQYYKRDFEDSIESWYTGGLNNNALVVTGARQVGKTTGILNWASRTNRKLTKLDFSKNKNLIDPICNASSYEEVIEIVCNAYAIKEKDIDVLFLDEIQLHPDSLYLCRLFKGQRIKLICSGSLLGTKLSKHATRTDVGSKIYLRVFPLSFKEFLKWLDKENLLSLIDKAYETKEQILPYFHKELMDLFYLFLIIGGMPEVVSTYLRQGKVISKELYTIKDGIYEGYMNDNKESFYAFDKNKVQTIKTIDLMFNKIDTFIIQPENKRFIISDINKSFRYSNIEIPLSILLNSNIAIGSYAIEVPKFPLHHHMLETQFKLYYSDVGLLTHKLNLDYNSLNSFLQNNTSPDLWGGVVENFVAQELQSSKLCFWKTYLDKTNRYEVDFLLEDNSDCSIIPCEVKSHTKKHSVSTSLNKYIETYNPKKVICIGPNNFAVNGNKHYVPLYAVYKIKEEYNS